MENDIIVALTRVEQKVEDHDHEIRDLKKRADNTDDFISAVKVLSAKQDNMESDVKEIKEDVKSLKAVPGKRWEAVVEKVILVVVGALVGYFLVRLGVG